MGASSTFPLVWQFTTEPLPANIICNIKKYLFGTTEQAQRSITFVSVPSTVLYLFCLHSGYVFLDITRDSRLHALSMVRLWFCFSLLAFFSSDMLRLCSICIASISCIDFESLAEQINFTIAWHCISIAFESLAEQLNLTIAWHCICIAFESLLRQFNSSAQLFFRFPSNNAVQQCCI